MQVSKQVVGAAAAAFVVLVVIIAFLLGRESQRHERRLEQSQLVGAAGTSPQGSAESPQGQPQAPPASTLPTPSPSVTTPPDNAPAPATPPTTIPVPTPVPAAPPSSSGSSNAAQIRDYFLRMDTIQTGGMGDTEEVAGKLLTGAMKGDLSGLDDLIKSVDDSVSKVKAITPPAECAGYHAKMIELLAQSQQLVRSLKQAMQSQDPSAIAGIAMTGEQLKTKTEALQTEAKAIRSRAGL